MDCSVVDVVRVNEQIMYVKLVIGKQIGYIVSAHAPQVGLNDEEKGDFWDSIIIVLSGIPKKDSIFTGRPDWPCWKRYRWLWQCPWCYGYGTRKAEGEMIL